MKENFPDIYQNLEIETTNNKSNNKIVEEIKLSKIYQLVRLRNIELMIVVRKVKGKVG